MTRPVSKRAAGLQASPIRKLMPQATAAKARGVHVHHLNIGQPDIPSPEVVLSALRDLPDRVISYAQSQGEPSYLKAVHRYYASLGHDLPDGSIRVTVGGSEALVLAFLIALDPGDEVLVPEPFYTNYASFARIAGVTLAPLTTRGEDGFHLPPADIVEARIGPRTRAFLLCNPSNPTGTVHTRAELETLSRLARKHDLWMILDEVYREFVFDPRPDDPRTSLDLPDLDDRLLVVDSVSKRYSLCGARLGCLVSRNPAVNEAALRIAQARLSAPRIEQQICERAHDLPAGEIQAMVDVYRRRRDVAFDALTRMPGVRVARPEGAFYTLPRLPVDDAERFAAWLLTDFEHEGETVMVAPAAGFYATPGLGRDEIRLAFVLDVQPLRRAMACLERALEVYPGRV